MRPRYRIAFIDQSIRGRSMRLPWMSVDRTCQESENLFIMPIYAEKRNARGLNGFDVLAKSKP
jgi:hypothetical protein